MWMDVGFDNQPAVDCLSVATTATIDLLIDGHNLVASARVHISSVSKLQLVHCSRRPANGCGFGVFSGSQLYLHSHVRL